LWLVEQAGDYATPLFHHFRDATALGPALDTITAQDASGFCRHAGYRRPN
jgi:hypothetical protein